MFHYLDNAATTPVRPEAAQAAWEAMTKEWGNPSSQYAFGKKGRRTGANLPGIPVWGAGLSSG